MSFSFRLYFGERGEEDSESGVLIVGYRWVENVSLKSESLYECSVVPTQSWLLFGNARHVLDGQEVQWPRILMATFEDMVPWPRSLPG